MTFATCRGCDRTFAKDGWSSQSPTAPRLCRDCATREREFHGKHAPGTECLAKFMAVTA